MEVATLPPLVDVSMMHMLTVVGKHVRIKIPSTKAGSMTVEGSLENKTFRGMPIKSGQRAKMEI